MASTICASFAEQACRSFGALCEFVGSQGWTTPWTRLVLHDVYVRTHMTFAAATWAPHYLRSHGAADRATPLG